jgi:pentatricopeptide repeat protein
LQKINDAEIHPNEITYNTIIDICVKAGVMPLAIHFFDEMQDLRLKPDAFTYSTLLKGFRMNDFKIQDWSCNNPAIREVYPNLDVISYQCSIQKALEIFSLYKEAYGNQVDDVIFNCMIDTCLRMKLSTKAYELF